MSTLDGFDSFIGHTQESNWFNPGLESRPNIMYFNHGTLESIYDYGMSRGELLEVHLHLIRDCNVIYKWVPLTLDILDRIKKHECSVIDYREMRFLTLSGTTLLDIQCNQHRSKVNYEVCVSYTVTRDCAHNSRWEALTDEVIRHVNFGNYYVSGFRRKIEKTGPTVVRSAVQTGSRYRHNKTINVAKTE
jgi:hypothetical protein